MIKKISNITFRVSDLKKSKSFYEDILGLKKIGEWSNYVTFDVAGTILGLEPDGKKGKKEDAPDIYLTVGNVDEAYQTLKERGVKFATEPKDQYWGARTAALLDPDENMFILVQLKSEKLQT